MTVARHLNHVYMTLILSHQNVFYTGTLFYCFFFLFILAISFRDDGIGQKLCVKDVKAKNYASKKFNLTN